MEKALLVIDMVNGFAEKGYNHDMYCKNGESIKPRIKEVIDKFIDKNMLVVYCCDSHIEGDSELKKNGGPWDYHCMNGTEESQIVKELPTEGIYTVKRGEKIDDKLILNKKVLRVDKGSYSAFFNTSLKDILDKNSVKELYISGLVTSVCVQHTSADAFFNGYKINILEDCCADMTKEKHDNALEYMKNNYSAKIIHSSLI